MRRQRLEDAMLYQAYLGDTVYFEDSERAQVEDYAVMFGYDVREVEETPDPKDPILWAHGDIYG